MSFSQGFQNKNLTNNLHNLILNNITNQIFNQISNSTIDTYDAPENLKPINTNENFINNVPKAAKEGENFLSAKSLIAIIILVVHTIAAPIFEKLHFHYIHESGISMLLGMIVGLVALVISPTVII